MSGTGIRTHVRPAIWTIVVLAVLFAAGIEALASHRHHDGSGGQRCAICRVTMHAPADAPRAEDPVPTALAANPDEPVAAVPTGSAPHPPLAHRLRAPPTA